jgi:protein-S-isoprenylcysteine O-methyltransferase Ste14
VALREELEHAGNWLFRRRSFLPLLLLPLLFAAMRGYTYPRGSHRLDLLWEAGCLLVGLAGLAVRAGAIGYAPRGTSGHNRGAQQADSLNTTALYSVVRHPLYLGNYLMWLALAAVPRVWWLPLFVTLVFWLYYERIMYAEEAFLHRRFGAAFERWAALTPALVPRLSLWKPPERPFSWRAVLRREYSPLLVLLACFALLDVVGDLAYRGRFVVDDFWLVAVAAVAVLSAALRIVRRRTRWLDVLDR